MRLALDKAHSIAAQGPGCVGDPPDETFEVNGHISNFFE